MGFGSAAAAMNASLKNNRALLKGKRKSLFDKDKRFLTGNDSKLEFDTPEARSYHLVHIRERLQRENRERRFWIIFITVGIASTLLAVFFTYL